MAFHAIRRLLKLIKNKIDSKAIINGSKCELTVLYCVLLLKKLSKPFNTYSMKYFSTFFLFLLTFTSLFGQTRRMVNAETGKTYTVENLADTPWPLLQKAEQRMRSLDLESAFFITESAVAQHPNSSEALLYRAKVKNLMGMEAEAKADLNMAERLNPYAVDLYGPSRNSGLLRLLSTQPERSTQKLTAFQKLNYYYDFLDEKIVDNVYESAAVQLIGQLLEQIDAEALDQAEETLDELLHDYPNLAISHDLKGMLLLKQDYTLAAKEGFSQAVNLTPDFAIGWYNLGHIEYLLGDLDLAKEHMNKAIELDPSLTKAYFERAAILKAMGDSASALADYDTIIARNGAAYPEALLNRGLTNKMTGAYAEALSDLSKVIEQTPNDPQLRKNRGNIYLLLNLIPKALDEYTKAIQLENNYPEAYFNRAIGHFLLLDNVSGCADLKKSSTQGHTKATEMRQYFCPGS